MNTPSALLALRPSADRGTIEKFLPLVHEMGLTPFTGNWIANMAFERGVFEVSMTKKAIVTKVHRVFRVLLKLGLIHPSGSYGYYSGDPVRITLEIYKGSDPAVREARRIIERGFQGGRGALRIALSQALALLEGDIGVGYGSRETATPLGNVGKKTVPRRSQEELTA